MTRKKVKGDNGVAEQFESDWVNVAERKEAVVLVLTFEEAWFTMTAIQAASAGVPDGVPARDFAIEVARKIQRLVSKTPTLAAVADSGFGGSISS